MDEYIHPTIQLFKLFKIHKQFKIDNNLEICIFNYIYLCKSVAQNN